MKEIRRTSRAHQTTRLKSEISAVEKLAYRMVPEGAGFTNRQMDEARRALYPLEKIPDWLLNGRLGVAQYYGRKMNGDEAPDAEETALTH